MADTHPLAPTDAELDELRQANSGKLNFVTFSEFRTIARAVLAKWGAPPAVAGEPVAWNGLTDEDRERAMNSMPGMLEGFTKTWGWLHFAKAIEAICREKNAQPAPQGETNAHLDTDSNSSAPGQQRDVAGTVALGQSVGHGSDSTAGDPSAQGDKLLTVAERNIRSFLRSATFKSESDREAALNCVDVLWAAARAPADSVTAPAATCPTCEAPCTTTVNMRGGEHGWGTTDLERTVYHYAPAQAADSVLEDAARLDWLDEDAGNHVTRVGKTWYTRPTYGHPYRKHKNLRAAIDAARAAQEGK